MDENITHAGHFAPWDIRMPVAEGHGYTFCGFADNLRAPDHRVHGLSVCRKRLVIHAAREFYRVRYGCCDIAKVVGQVPLPLYIFDLGQDALADGWLQGRLHHKVNLRLQPVFEVLAKVKKIEEIDVAAEGDKYIDIASFPLPPPDAGPEQPHLPDTIAGLHLGFAAPYAGNVGYFSTSWQETFWALFPLRFFEESLKDTLPCHSS